jgi:hypothetical protein
MNFLAAKVTVSVLGAVIVALAGIYVWADGKTQSAWETKFSSHVQAEEDRFAHQEKDADRIERKQDWMLERMGVGLPPGVQSAVEAHAKDGGTP